MGMNSDPRVNEVLAFVEAKTLIQRRFSAAIDLEDGVKAAVTEYLGSGNWFQFEKKIKTLVERSFNEWTKN